MQDPSYKTEHCEIFREMKLSWPPCYADFGHIDFAGMSERVAEATIMVDKLFPAPAGAVVLQFYDANPSLKRLLVADSEGKLKDVWRSHPMTLTGQSQLIFRYKHPKVGKDICIRRVNIAEMFALIGWLFDSWGPETHCLLELDMSLASSFAGNAFSAYQIGPTLMALLPSVFAPQAQATEGEGGSVCIDLLEDSSSSEASEG